MKTRVQALVVALWAGALASCGGGGGGGSTTPTIPQPQPSGSSAPSGAAVGDMTITLANHLVMTQPGTVNVTVNAFDGHGNPIVSGTYASPIVLTTSDTSGRTTLGNATLRSAGSIATLSYNGKADQFTLTATSGAVTRTFTFSTVLPPEITLSQPSAIPQAVPQLLRVAPDGSLWGSFNGGVTVARITNTGQISGITDPSHGSDSPVFAFDGNGAMWIDYHDGYTEQLGLDRITSAGQITSFPFVAPYGFAHVASIIKGGDGAMWAAGDGWNPSDPSYILRCDLTGNMSVIAQITAKAQNLVYGPDGNYWFSGDDNNVYKMTPSGTVTSYPMPLTGANLRFIAGPDGNFWAPFAYGTPNLLKFSTSGAVVSVTGMPSQFSTAPSIHDLAKDANGNVYGVDWPSNALVRITPAGVVTEYQTYGWGSDPSSVAVAPDGTVYVADVAYLQNGGTGAIVRIDPSLW